MGRSEAGVGHGRGPDMGLIWLFIFGFIGTTILYFTVAWFARSTRRERLEKRWDAANPGGDPKVRRVEVEQGVDAFRASLAYRLLWLIYIIPAAVVLATLILTNWN